MCECVSVCVRKCVSVRRALNVRLQSGEHLQRVWASASSLPDQVREMVCVCVCVFVFVYVCDVCVCMFVCADVYG